jgi:hypothetical protein
MTKEELTQKACQVLRRRVRFKTASLALPTTPFPGHDTPAIRAATRLYVETWIVPLLDCIESGDMGLVREYYQHEEGDEMEKANASDQLPRRRREEETTENQGASPAPERPR